MNKVRGAVQIIVLVVLLSFYNGYAQNSQTINHAFHDALVFGFEAGVTLPQTDYEKIKTGFSLRAAGEYFINTNSSHLFGFKIKLGSEKVEGEDSRSSISTDEGTNEISPTFTTSIFSAGIAFTYSFSIDDIFFPYLSVGFSNLWIDPQNDQNKPATGNVANLYSKSVKAYSFEIGFRYLFSDRLSLNLSANPYFPLTDYLDDVAASNENDSYTSILLGFSYSLFFDNDPDGDGITGKDDLCQTEQEDFDGFEDEDGCPDYDNDGDGITDLNDLCPNEAENYNGIEDEDGCPDYDNDGDKIINRNDQCPNAAEDFDGFEDEDGCPDYDNDADGIPDLHDKCPDQPETINGFNDDDGCPDTLSTVNIPDSFILQGDSVFFKGSHKLKFEIKSKLDEIIKMIKQLPDSRWIIEAHMDAFGSERDIRILSLERAKAVLEYFEVFGGLDHEKFKIYGMGDKFPVADNKTEEGRAKNRRVLIIKE